jgi:cell division protein FtsB
VSNDSWGQILLDRIDATERRLAAEVRDAADLSPTPLDEDDLDAALDPLRAEVRALAAAVERLAPGALVKPRAKSRDKDSR